MKLKEYREVLRAAWLRVKTKESRVELFGRGMFWCIRMQPYIFAAPGIVLILGAPTFIWPQALQPLFWMFLSATSGLALLVLSFQVNAIFANIISLLRQVQASIIFRYVAPVDPQDQSDMDLESLGDKTKFH